MRSDLTASMMTAPHHGVDFRMELQQQQQQREVSRERIARPFIPDSAAGSDEKKEENQLDDDFSTALGPDDGDDGDEGDEDCEGAWRVTNTLDTAL